MRIVDAFRSRDFAAIGYISAWKVLGLLPVELVRRGFEFVATLVARKHDAVRQLSRNLGRVVDKPEAEVAPAMRSYARYWAEAFCLPSFDRARLWERLDQNVQGRRHLRASLDQGKGVVLTLPHSGNWDMAGVWLVGYAGQFTTVAERLKPEVLFDAFVEFREGLGFEVLAHTGGKQAPFDRLQEVLREGGIVCLLGERDLKGRGVPTSFFGEATTFPAGPAQLALSTGAALHTVSSYFTPSGWSFEISSPLEVDDLDSTVARIARNFEDDIAAHPEDWHMLQSLWLADRKRH
ncbi:phosphatidylinositol mannoside acyltransferase [Corynebacterium sp. H130]|uniref:phosphatidylinositol mannoside acyltransferase n=1 Tax=Corynebacterium sp. H130 TaxID=3133444 RepID=UPI0030B4E9EC